MKPYLEQLRDGDKVLDLGCGNGRLLLGVKAEINYLGIDNSKTLLGEARKLHQNDRFVEGELTERKLWKDLGSFDAIFCVAVLHHIPGRKAQLEILKECRKHLQKDGVLYLSVWNLWQFNYWKCHFQSIALKLSNWRYVYIPFQKFEKRFCIALGENYIKELLIEAGLSIEKVNYVDKNGENTNWLMGRNLLAIGRVNQVT